MTCDVVMTCGRPAGHRGHHGGFRPVQGGARLAALTARELQTLLLVADGLTIQGVADQMGISDQTVKNNLTIIYAKLDVSGRIGALHAAGWLQVPA